MPTRPNFLIFMVDQLNGTFFPDGPAEWLHAPNLSRLAESSVRFSRAYNPSPLCAPARAGIMAGRLPSRTGVYDNAAEFPGDIPTFAHYLRRAGYRTCLSGKMHFVGADQLHGYEERLTTDIYPADYGWTPDYRKPDERIDWWYHTLNSVKSAGVAEMSNQIEYDDEVAYHAVRRIFDFAREDDGKPWMLTVSFTHPHDPYVTKQEYWDMFADCKYLQPEVPALDYGDHDPHSRRILDACDWQNYPITDDDIMRSRRAYFGNISYIDDKIGDVLAALDAVRQSDRTVIIFVSDHGDMLGERGLWFKMSFFEGSSCVPLMVASSELGQGSCKSPVSTMDLAPTIAELAGIDLDQGSIPLDGVSLCNIVNYGGRNKSVAIEYAAEASISPIVAIVGDEFKYVHCNADLPMLFNLREDPHELKNLASFPCNRTVVECYSGIVEQGWDLEDFDAKVRESQARRILTYEALRNGAYYPWDYQPLQKASERYMRNHLNLNTLEEDRRFPKLNQ